MADRSWPETMAAAALMTTAGSTANGMVLTTAACRWMKEVPQLPSKAAAWWAPVLIQAFLMAWALALASLMAVAWMAGAMASAVVALMAPALMAASMATLVSFLALQERHALLPTCVSRQLHGQAVSPQ